MLVFSDFSFQHFKHLFGVWTVRLLELFQSGIQWEWFDSHADYWARKQIQAQDIHSSQLALHWAQKWQQLFDLISFGCPKFRMLTENIKKSLNLYPPKVAYVQAHFYVWRIRVNSIESTEIEKESTVQQDKVYNFYLGDIWSKKIQSWSWVKTPDNSIKKNERI